MKIKHLVASSVLLFSSLIFAQQYKIESVDYEITGITKKYALEQKIKIDKKRFFPNEHEFLNYFNDLRQRFYNERNFQNSELDFTVDEANAENI